MSLRAKEVAEQIIDDLTGRRGFDHWWDDLDESIKDDIERDIAKRIHDNYGA